MLTLILETSSEQGILLLAQGKTPLKAVELPGGQSLCETIAVEVKKLVYDKNIALELIAVGIGPGSYTGVRSAVCFGRALSYAHKIPLIGFCSLKAFGPPPVLFDAKAGGFYALFEENALPQKIPCIESLPPKTQARTPHFKALREKLPETIEIIAQKIDPARLSSLVFKQFAEEGAKPFTISYL